MADVWPISLPQVFEEGGWSRTQIDNTIATENDAGPDTARPRSTAAPAIVTGSMMLTAAQYSTLDTFFLTHQAARFQWANPAGSTRYYRFKQPPKYSAWSVYYRVQLVLVEFLTEFGGG